jgi:MFS transporter, DHA2 family, multidrug resistance protein
VSSHDISGPERTVITVAVLFAILMQVLDQTIANVALPHMQASLGATRETINWVLTSYIVASAIAIPITGWLAERVGRKRLYILSVIGFTIASLLCAMAQNLAEIVLFRALQGVAGAFLVPLGQAVLFDINPPEKHGRAMATFSAGVMIGPIMGPMLGGWLTENFDWRWVFLINLPIGLIATVMMMRFLPTAPKTRRRFDLFGFALLAVALGGLQMMLDRGEQLDWFASWEVWVECGLAISGIWMFVVHTATGRNPLFPPELFKDTNFTSALAFISVTGVMLLAGLALLPPLLQGLFGYSVFQAGLLTMPRGIGALVSMLFVGRLIGKVDARLIILAGVSLMAVSLWQMSGFALNMDQRPIIVSGIVQGLGMGFIFVPLQTIAFGTLDAKHRTTAASLLNLGRNIGGSIGISVVMLLLARNLQVSHADLAAHITPYSLPPINPAITQGVPGGVDMAVAMAEAEINRQALMIAYIDDFYLMMILALCSVPLLLLMRRGKRPTAGETPAMD